MSLETNKILRYETDPESFDELVSDFLLDSGEKEAEELFDLVQNSEILRRRFESLVSVHRGLETLYTKNKNKPESPFFSGKTFLWAAAACVFLVPSIYFFSNQLNVADAERIDSYSFGTCEVTEGTNNTSLRSGPLSICEFLFHTRMKGRRVRIRLLPESNLEIANNEISWEIHFQKGNILVDSSLDSSFFGKYPNELNVYLGNRKLIFLGTKVSLKKEESDRFRVKILEGKIRIENESFKTADILSQGEQTLIDLNRDITIEKLSAPEFKEMEEAFSSISPSGDKTVTNTKGNNPGKILFPDASPVPGNRIIFKNGESKKGTGLLQRGETYILIDRNKMEEFHSSEIKRIEFE